MSDLPLDTLAGMINAKLKKAQESEDRGDNFRRSAGCDLQTARGRVEQGEAGSVSFQSWCAECIEGPRIEIAVCIAMANSPDERREVIRTQLLAQLSAPAPISRHDEKPARTHIRVPTGKPRGRPPGGISQAARDLGMTEPTLRRDVAAVRAADAPTADPWLADMVARWRRATPDQQAAFREHIA